MHACGLGTDGRLGSLVRPFFQWLDLVGRFGSFDTDTLAYWHLIPFELGDTCDDVQHEGAGGRRGVDVHIEDADRYALVGECLGDRYHVGDVARCTVDLRDRHLVASPQAVHQECPLGAACHGGIAYLLRVHAVASSLPLTGEKRPSYAGPLVFLKRALSHDQNDLRVGILIFLKPQILAIRLFVLGPDIGVDVPLRQSGRSVAAPGRDVGKTAWGLRRLAVRA